MLKLLKKISTALQGIVTTTFLTVFYILVFVPYALIIKHFIKDSLDLNINRTVPTYWINNSNNNKFHRQF